MKNLFNKNNKVNTTVTTKTQGVSGMKNVLNKTNVVKGANIINEAAMIFGAISLLAQGAKEIYKFAKEKKQEKKLTDCEVEELTKIGLGTIKNNLPSVPFEDSTLTILLYNSYKNQDFSKLGEVLSKEYEEKEVDEVIEKLVLVSAK